MYLYHEIFYGTKGKECSRTPKHRKADRGGVLLHGVAIYAAHPVSAPSHRRHDYYCQGRNLYLCYT